MIPTCTLKVATKASVAVISPSKVSLSWLPISMKLLKESVIVSSSFCIFPLPNIPETTGHNKEATIRTCPIIGIALKRAVPNKVTAPRAAVAPTLIFVQMLPLTLPRLIICSLEYFTAAPNLPLILVAFSISFNPREVKPEALELP